MYDVKSVQYCVQFHHMIILQLFNNKAHTMIPRVDNG